MFYFAEHVWNHVLTVYIDVTGVIRFWDYLAQQCVYTIDEHRTSRQTLGVAVNCTTDSFITFGADNDIFVYDLATKSRLTHLTHSYVTTLHAPIITVFITAVVPIPKRILPLRKICIEEIFN